MVPVGQFVMVIKSLVRTDQRMKRVGSQREEGG